MANELQRAPLAIPVPPGFTNNYSPYILSRSAIPFVGLSSGSVAAGGAISGITALPVAYASAYCWFPANALAAAIAAGWYYCTFSSTTAGTAFLNTYTSGDPVIPATTTAVTAGQGSFTGDTGEEFGPTITVPANALGPNGALRSTVSMSVTNNVNAKTYRLRWSGNAGTIFMTQNPASQNVFNDLTWIQNRGATNSQFSSKANVATLLNGGLGALGGATVYQSGAIDTTAATTLVLSMQRGVATDNAVIESYLIELLYGA